MGYNHSVYCHWPEVRKLKHAADSADGIITLSVAVIVPGHRVSGSIPEPHWVEAPFSSREEACMVNPRWFKAFCLGLEGGASVPRTVTVAIRPGRGIREKGLKPDVKVTLAERQPEAIILGVSFLRKASLEVDGVERKLCFRFNPLRRISLLHHVRGWLR